MTHYTLCNRLGIISNEIHKIILFSFHFSLLESKSKNLVLLFIEKIILLSYEIYLNRLTMAIQKVMLLNFN